MRKNIKRLCLSIMMMFVLVLVLPTFLNVDKAEAAVKISKKKVSLMVGESETIKMKGTKKKVTWTTSDNAVASVSKGKITAKKEGNATITATVGKKSYTCAVTVKGDWRKIYKNALASGKMPAGKYSISPYYYRTLNINKKGVPELVVTENTFGGYTTFYVYTVKSAKLKYLGNCSTKDGSFYPMIRYSSKYKGLRTESWINGVGGYCYNLYTISSSKLKCTKYMIEHTNPKKKFWTSTNGTKKKKVSKSAYLKFYKKYMKTVLTYSMTKNTASFRERDFAIK